MGREFRAVKLVQFREFRGRHGAVSVSHSEECAHRPARISAYDTSTMRPSLEALPEASSSSIIVHPAISEKLYPLLSQLSFHVVPANVDDINNIYAWIEELGGRCVSADRAKYIVTALKGRPRLVRAIGQLVG